MCHNYSKKAFVRLKTQIVIITPRQKTIVHSKYNVDFAVLLLLVLIRGAAGNLRIILSESAGNELFSRLPTSLTLMIVFFLVVHYIPDMAQVHKSLRDRPFLLFPIILQGTSLGNVRQWSMFFIPNLQIQSVVRHE